MALRLCCARGGAFASPFLFLTASIYSLGAPQ